jgi:hypothetical protein
MTVQCNGPRFAVLDMVLLGAIVTFLAILFPSVIQLVFDSLDLRQWKGNTWFIANLGVVVVLVSVRFGPDLVRDWRERRRSSVRQREKGALANRAKERRESSERLDDSRKRTTF